MNASVQINNLSIDNFEAVKTSIENNEFFDFTIYKGEMDKQDAIGIEVIGSVGVFIEYRNHKSGCTIMFDLTKENALYLSDALKLFAQYI